MFENSIDKKGTYTTDDGIEIVDLANSIFQKNANVTKIGTFAKASKEYEMRPDLVAKVLYGSTKYTEMVLKYSLIPNPFALEKGDIIYNASVTNIYNPIKNEIVNADSGFDLVKNYHKYIDKKKVPNSPGSQPNTTSIPDVPQESNLSKTGDTGISIVNGKMYFGNIDEKLKDVDSSIVDCATDGTTIGQFLSATLKNSK